MTARETLTALKPVIENSAFLARRVRQHLSQAVRWAIVNELRAATNPFDDVTAVLPIKAPKHTPRKALPNAAVPAALAKVREWGESDPRFATRALAMEYVILTGARVGEAYGATWSEIQGDVWSLSADRMKGGYAAPRPAVRRRPWTFCAPREGSELRRQSGRVPVAARRDRNEVGARR